MDFSYLLQKISDAPINQEPFPHIQINNLFEPEDFEKIVTSEDILTAKSSNDDALFTELFKSNYRIIEFPGCTIDKDEYIKWHKTKNNVQKTNTSCEGFGTVLRLTTARTDIVKSLQEFMMSKDFINCIAKKFKIDQDECNYDAGIQKYLDGYEISPHPDIRRKALTYMVNINPDPDSSSKNHHTSYLQFKNTFNYVKEFWQGNPDYNRCWVPWEWCDIKKQQVENNSIVIFSPSNETMHAVKADYNHYTYQRTQLYGNLWYKESEVIVMPNWEDLALPKDVKLHKKNTNDDVVKSLLDLVPYRIKSLWKKDTKVSSQSHADRKY